MLNRGFVCAFLVVLAWGPRPAAGAGFELDEQDVELMATAFAGRAAASANAATIWWNPAGMARLKGWNYNAGVNWVFVDGAYSDQGSTSAVGSPMLGDTNDNGGTDGLIPNLYVSRSLGERWVVGIGVNAPFALSTQYSATSTVRYFATLSEILVINIEPAASFRINEQWSVGAGLMLQHASGTLGNQIDFGSIGASLTIPGLIPQAFDGSVKVDGDSVSVGFTVGVLFEMNEKNRFGLSYRSQVKHKIEGDADFSVPDEASGVVDATGAFVDTDASLDMTLPDKFILSGFHQVHSKWAVVWDVSYTNWSTIDEIRIKFENPNQPDSVLDMQWDGSWRVSTGAIYSINDKWILRFGVAWDQSPIPDETRGPRLPGSDRFWVAVGGTYIIKPWLRLQVAYFHIFVDQTSIDQSEPAAGNLVGTVNGGVDAFSVGFTGTF